MNVAEQHLRHRSSLYGFPVTKLAPNYFRLNGPEGELVQGNFDVINNFLDEKMVAAMRSLSPAAKDAFYATRAGAV